MNSSIISSTNSSTDGSTQATFALPEPDTGAVAHSDELVARIRAEIHACGGRIPFQRYMELVLYAPGYGYYSAGSQKFGPAGDFVTAPEISPLFSRCVAAQVEQIIGHLGRGAVLEVGAGSGALTEEIILQLERSDVVPSAYFVLETSPELKVRQEERLRQRLSGCRTKVQWLTEYPTKGFRGVILANEVLDAMPVCRFQGGTAPSELFVAHDGERLHFVTGEIASPGLAQALVDLEQTLGRPFESDYISELGLLQRGWIAQMLQRVQAGVLLLFDYGYARDEYYHRERNNGTLSCFFRHRRHDDPFMWPGLQDLSAHVDFSAIAEAGIQAGAELAGYTTQANFLLASGLLDHLAEFAPGTEHYMRLAGEVKRLTLPSEMGDVVKVMALSQQFDVTLLGFSGRDFRTQL